MKLQQQFIHFFSKKKNHTNVLCFIHVYVWYHKHNIYIYPKHICLYIYRILKKSTNKTMKQARHLGSAGLFLYLFFYLFFFQKKKLVFFNKLNCVNIYNRLFSSHLFSRVLSVQVHGFFWLVLVWNTIGFLVQKLREIICIFLILFKSILN